MSLLGACTASMHPACGGCPCLQTSRLAEGCTWLPVLPMLPNTAASSKPRLRSRRQAPQVSAVSPKTNTTEQMRLGAFTSGAAQVVLYDTPGVVGKE